ncbi:hypothetical protein CFK37_01785 [Virgibacillus phasianinus]|uniref:Uncharacterized protein n=1 Tax=Virgibacillus phasianinus TaxID=2017483 RepID=A0A220TZE6_9BACI|nr:hypothetical protein [Virgibacillus phasianinus]ASK61031.1 hypothetical protein CFK37_01785 [Virgibacillus phasianinus]
MYENIIAKILFIIGVAEITIGIFVGIVFGAANADFGNQFGWGIFFTWSIGGFILGMLFIGFAENIQLLQRIYLKMGDDKVEMDFETVMADETSTAPEDWYLPVDDREKIEHYYKNETILEITPSQIEGYCIVKLEYGSNEFVRVVDIHGFGVHEVEDEEIKSSIITWYNNLG